MLGPPKGWFVYRLKVYWFYMLEVPWGNSLVPDDRAEHWITWLLGWSWALAGMVFGALLAPLLVAWAGLSTTVYQDWLVIGVAVLAGFVVQLLGWCLLITSAIVTYSNRENTAFLGLGIIMLPFVGVGYGIYRYLTWVGVGQRSVTVAFVGALLLKTFAVPLIKGLVTGVLFKRFVDWLRGDEAKEKNT